MRTTECLEEELFRQHQETIMKGLPDLVMNYPDSKDILRTLFEIVEQTQLLPKLVEAWRKFITETGQKHLNMVKKDSAETKVYQVMEEIFWLKKRTDCVLQDCFNDKRALKLEAKSSFEHIFNEQNRSDRSAKLLASYINFRLTNSDETDAGSILIDSTLILSLFRA